MQSDNHILKSLLSLGLNYLRWTQLAPMFMMWGFALLMLLALTFVNYQEQTLSAVEHVLRWLTQLPIAGEYITQLLSDESTEKNMTKGDLKSFALTAWSVTSLLFMLVGMALSALFGPFKPWSLKLKLSLAGLGVMLLMAGLLFNYYANTVTFNGATSGWMLNFSLICLAVFLVSAYSLTISHFLRFLNDQFLTGSTAENANIKYDLD